MGTKYHYDRRGRYIGKTTDDPPFAWLGGLLIMAVLVFGFRGCSAVLESAEPRQAAATQAAGPGETRQRRAALERLIREDDAAWGIRRSDAR